MELVSYNVYNVLSTAFGHCGIIIILCNVEGLRLVNGFGEVC
jgi:hypothetical protein